MNINAPADMSAAAHGAIPGRLRQAGPDIACAVAVALVLAAYVPTLATPFFAVDDPNYVTNNEVLQQTPLLRPWRFFTTRTNPIEYLPLRDLSYRIDLALFGPHAWGFRVHNLILYALTCVAVWWFVMTVVPVMRGRAGPSDRWIAAVAAALFAAHPAHVESVAWVSGRKDLLSGLFGIVSLVMFTYAIRDRRPSWTALGISYALFACAILSKSTVVPVAVVAWLIVLARQDWTSRRLAAAGRATVLVLPFVLQSGVSVALQIWASATYATEPFDGVEHRSLAEAVLLPVRIFGTLVRITVFPVHPRLIYDVEAPGDLLTFVSLLGVAAPAATLACAWFGVRNRSPLAFGIAMTGILLAPFVQLIPFYTWSYASDRFLFLPVAGAALSVAALVSFLPARWMLALAGILVGAATAGTATRAAQWRDQKALFQDTFERAPNHRVAAELGVRWVLLPERRFAEARAAADRVRVPGPRYYLQTYVDASEAMSRGDVARLRPLVPPLLQATQREDYSARLEVANMALVSGLIGPAERAYREILDDFPAAHVVRYNLGLLLARQGRHREAAAAMQAAIDRGYVTAAMLNNLGLARRNAGETQQAEQAFRRALAIDQRHWHAAYNLARLLWAHGDRAGARAALRDARRRAEAIGDPLAPLTVVEAAMDVGPPAPR